MMERASIKLSKIIDILEKEVQIREFCKLQKKRGIYFEGQSGVTNLDIIDDESSEDSSMSDNETKTVGKKQGEGVSTNITLPTTKLPKKRSSTRVSKPGSAILHSLNGTKQYSPFRSYRKDLRLLITFKSMIAKSVHEMTPESMIDGGVLMAIAFAIDQSERKLMLSNIEYINKVVQAAQSAMFTGAALNTKE